MKIEDHMYIQRGDVALSITVEGYYSGDHSDGRPSQKEYGEWAADAASALNDVADALIEIDEMPNHHPDDPTAAVDADDGEGETDD